MACPGHNLEEGRQRDHMEMKGEPHTETEGACAPVLIQNSERRCRTACTPLGLSQHKGDGREARFSRGRACVTPLKPTLALKGHGRAPEVPPNPPWEMKQVTELAASEPAVW